MLRTRTARYWAFILNTLRLDFASFGFDVFSVSPRSHGNTAAHGEHMHFSAGCISRLRDGILVASSRASCLRGLKRGEIKPGLDTRPDHPPGSEQTV